MILKYDIMFEFNIGYLIMHMITSNMNIKAVNDIDIDICCHCWIESWPVILILRYIFLQFLKVASNETTILH